MRAPDNFLSLLALVAVALLLSACAGASFAPVQSGPPVPAPILKVGDRWVYHGIDGYRVKTVWDETHEITAIDTTGIAVRVTLKGPTLDVQRTEKWSAPGIVIEGAVYEAETDLFEPPLVRYQYPLTTGASWSQRVRDTLKPPGPYGPIMRHVSVDGYETVNTPAGTFDAIRLSVVMTLDDETFWRYPTQCEYTIWYSAVVGAFVQERKRSTYQEKGDTDPGVYHPGQNAQIELVSFTRR